jgi:hypothetical protein
MPTVSLSDALDITLLAAEKDPERYDAMAGRWIARMLAERRATLREIKWTAERLQARVEEARKALRGFVG